MRIPKSLYYVLNFTWGILMSSIGAVVALVLMIAGYRPKRHAGSIYFNVGKAWGGADLGVFVLTDEQDSKAVKDHEFGHSIQNCLWGPLMPFVICLPSAIRYWLRLCKTREYKEKFTLCLTTVLCCSSVLFTFVAIVLQLEWLAWLMTFVFVYTAVVSSWMQNDEIPKYDNGDVPYDAVWFESQATSWGTEIAKNW